MNEPRLTVELEDDETIPPAEWTARALLELARQMGIMNDYYYPLIGAAGMIRALKDGP